MRHLKIVPNEVPNEVPNKVQKLMSHEIEAMEVFIYDESYGIYTKEAYNELILQMCTGDYHVHKAIKKIVNKDNCELIYLKYSDSGTPMFTRGDQDEPMFDEFATEYAEMGDYSDIDYNE